MMNPTSAPPTRVPFSYLDRQFADLAGYLEDVARFVATGDFTLGKPLAEFEARFARLSQAPFGIGVGSGTDALILSLKALGIAPGDEVITTPMTFIATVGAIVAAGARPVFVDSEDGFVIDPARIAAAITPRTRAIVPVHYTGNMAHMTEIMAIARRNDLVVIEDACQAVGAALGGAPAGSFGHAACFSLHPLKNINVWGDGGMIVTRSADLAGKLRLLRNHGLASRDEATVFGVNSRLDTLQAVVGLRLLGELDSITERRREIAGRYDAAFAGLSGFVQVPARRPEVRHVHHLYMVRASRRDELLAALNDRGIEAKVHYPIPVHLQKAAAFLGHRPGDFPRSEEDARRIITLPAHQHLTDREVEWVIEAVREFYGSWQ
jgi:dTDP-4-amino-4,6-dideoxygalactose transaminase